MARTLFTSRAESFDVRSGDARAALAHQLQIELQFMEQVHGDLVVTVESASADAPQCDALVTKVPGIGLAVMVADCLPILIDGGDVVAAVHAGRKGIISHVIAATIEQMVKLGSRPLSEFSAQIGPSICSRCYEVSPEMYVEVIAAFPAAATTLESHALDLQAVAVEQLLSAGLMPSAITEWGICTLESPHHFSYRGGDLLDRQVGIISL